MRSAYLETIFHSGRPKARAVRICVLAHHLQHRGAHQARDVADPAERRSRTTAAPDAAAWTDDVAGLAGADRRQPAEHHGEDQQRIDRDDEGRHGDDADREDADHGDRSNVPRRIDRQAAERDAESGARQPSDGQPRTSVLGSASKTSVETCRFDQTSIAEIAGAARCGRTCHDLPPESAGRGPCARSKRILQLRRGARSERDRSPDRPARDRPC